MRIQAAGGRVIYWDGPRVLGVLAMSRAIGKVLGVWFFIWRALVDGVTDLYVSSSQGIIT